MLESVNYEYIRQRILWAPQITVSVTQVRRLMAHDSAGGVIRFETEYPQLELYAGYSTLLLKLPPMLEGQTYFPTSAAAISVPVPPSTGQLILIATMREVSHDLRDPVFAVFDKNSNWGGGTQKLDTPKIWFENDRNFRKPLPMRVNGYEVTVQITPPGTLATF